jgi:hypothetical protein
VFECYYFTYFLIITLVHLFGELIASSSDDDEGSSTTKKKNTRKSNKVRSSEVSFLFFEFITYSMSDSDDLLL